LRLRNVAVPEVVRYFKLNLCAPAAVVHVDVFGNVIGVPLGTLPKDVKSAVASTSSVALVVLRISNASPAPAVAS
jgi:hypothetical protein